MVLSALGKGAWTLVMRRWQVLGRGETYSYELGSFLMYNDRKDLHSGQGRQIPGDIPKLVAHDFGPSERFYFAYQGVQE